MGVTLDKTSKFCFGTTFSFFLTTNYIFYMHC